MSDGKSLWEKYKDLLSKEIHLFPRRNSGAKEVKEEDQPSPEPQEEDVEKTGKAVGWGAKLRRLMPSKRGALLGLAVAIFMIIAFGAGYFALGWYLRAHASGSGAETQGQDDYGDWKTYQNETYHFEVRYPADWEVKEIKAGRVRFKPAKVEGSGAAPKDYIFIKVTSSKGRAETACEKNSEKCSFYANGIFGGRVETPETEEVFFNHGAKDFAITLYKYSSDTEILEDYIGISERLARSFRFSGEATKACKKTADCVLAIRVDKCCSCPEAVSQTELKANSSLVAWEAGKDYSGQKLLDCGGVYCSDCSEPIPPTVECIEDLCQ